MSAATKCGNVDQAIHWYPLADTLSFGAGITWVVHAEYATDIKESQRKIERITGYGIMGLFGAGAVYGYYVVAQCGSLRREVDARQDPAEPRADPTARRGFPASVFEFQFGMRQPAAEQACTAVGRSWQADESFAVCRAVAPARGAPDTKLEFQLGALSRITVLYGPSDSLASDYYRLYRSMLDRYGRPQVAPEPLSAHCQRSLAECLEQGEKPAGALWHWPSGSIELTPVWLEERAVLELRHSLEEPLTQ